MPKQQLRRLMLARRDALSVEQWQKCSRDAQQSLAVWSIFDRAKVIALYAPTRNEVDTDLLLRTALADGKRVCYPKVVGPALEFREVKGESDFMVGPFGIREPSEGNSVLQLMAIDLFVIPGVAFDLAGHRVGYGKGFYDRTLHLLEGSGKFVGLCHDFQVVDKLTGEAHDIPVDAIVTEQRFISVTRDYHTGGSH
jgi:5-formyltetrahydrofolate cyclo-ligase